MTDNERRLDAALKRAQIHLRQSKQTRRLFESGADLRQKQRLALDQLFASEHPKVLCDRINGDVSLEVDVDE